MREGQSERRINGLVLEGRVCSDGTEDLVGLIYREPRYKTIEETKDRECIVCMSPHIF